MRIRTRFQQCGHESGKIRKDRCDQDQGQAPQIQSSGTRAGL